MGTICRLWNGDDARYGACAAGLLRRAYILRLDPNGQDITSKRAYSRPLCMGSLLSNARHASVQRVRAGSVAHTGRVQPGNHRGATALVWARLHLTTDALSG